MIDRNKAVLSEREITLLLGFNSASVSRDDCFKENSSDHKEQHQLPQPQKCVEL